MNLTELAGNHLRMYRGMRYTKADALEHAKRLYLQEEEDDHIGREYFKEVIRLIKESDELNWTGKKSYWNV